MTQARAVCHVADREILTVNAALGDRPFDREGQWETMPADVPAPEDCPRPRCTAWTSATRSTAASTSAWPRAATLDELDGTPGDGRTLLWARIPEVLDGVDGAALAVLGDFVPLGVGQALGIRGGGNSLDNTLRVVRLVPTEWVLLDIRVHAVAARLRPRPRAHVRRGRHAAGHGQPELHRALLERTTADVRARATSMRRLTPDRLDGMMTLPVRPGMTVPLPGPLHTHRDRLAELADLGYTDIWSAEADGADAFTPLALAAAWEPRLRLGTAIVPAYTRSPACFAQSVASLADAAPGPVRHRHRLVEQRDRRAVERRPVRRAVQEGARRRALPPRRARRREGRQATYDTFEVQGFRLGIRPEQPPPILVAALREGMLRLAGREADGAIINWLSADDVPTVAGVVQRRRRRRGPRDRGPDLRLPERERRRRARRRPGSPSPPTSTCRCTPSSTAGWAAASCCSRCGTPGRPATARPPLAAIPDEVVDELIVHGSPEAVPGTHPAVLRQRRDDEQPRHDAARPRVKYWDAVRALAPSAG